MGFQIDEASIMKDIQVKMKTQVASSGGGGVRSQAFIDV